MQYRSEIDGLRALAIIPVILYHYDIKYFDWGFIGVDIFFVISGYLITSIILREIAQSSFSLIGFYERSAKRIFPAFFFTILITLIASYLIMSPLDTELYTTALYLIIQRLDVMLYMQIQQEHLTWPWVVIL